MIASQPPRLATWLLHQWGLGPQREALAGDLFEQYQRGRSSAWYWRQVVTAISIGAVYDIRHHPMVAVRAFGMGWASVLLVGRFTGALRQSLFGWWATNPWGTSEVLRQLWVWYGLPFVVINCLAFAATGWLIARWHRGHCAAAVVLGALSQLPSAIQWASYFLRLVRAGMWPGWGFREALLFQAVCLFLVYPLCLVFGGLWDAPPVGGGPSNSTSVAA